ncbi:MAG: XRE family transcriptional regulator [Mesotoga sp.]|nr:XRE family transcriptional regulator [Mesotoga sp.]
MKSIKKNSLGSSFDSFLEEEGIYEEVTLAAAKRVLAMQIQREMQKQDLSKAAMAHKMHTSRSALDRLLDPDNTSITLQTLDKAAKSLGRKVKISLA